MEGGDHITGSTLDDIDIMAAKAKLPGGDQRQAGAELYKLDVSTASMESRCSDVIIRTVLIQVKDRSSKTTQGRASL
ncbi:hypothetical protein J3R83DRAFT_12464 [Lanmaoa asiatica]|nr:hypothetical protein J3R83DRAFT_12464 [Lanmaoa asiatica]